MDKIDLIPSGKRHILEFMESPDKSLWIRYGPMQVYVRKGWHNIDRQITETFDIANVSIEQETLRGKGAFRAFVQDVESLYREYQGLFGDMKGVYVENVFSGRLQRGLERMGFEQVSRPSDVVSELVAPCYFSPWPVLWREIVRA